MPLTTEFVSLETGAVRRELSDLYLSYLVARVRLHDADGFADDVASLGDSETNSISSLIAAVIALPRLNAPPPADDDDVAQVIRRVPGKIWEAVDALSAEDQVIGLEVLARGGDVAVADAISRRMLISSVPQLTPDLVQRARVMAVRAALATTPKSRAAAHDKLRDALFGESGGIRHARLSQTRSEETGNLTVWPADAYAQQRLSDVRRAMERHDKAGIDAALDALAPVPIDHPTIAIDVVRVFEINGRFDEADEVFDDYVDTAESQLDGSSTGLNSLAWFCARTGRTLDKAYEMAFRATTAEPTNEAIKDTFAEAAFRIGKPQEAIAAESAALQVMPKYAFMIRQLDRFKGGLQPGEATRPMPSEAWEK